MVFGPGFKNVSEFCKIKIHNTELDYVNQCKYLGFYLLSDKHCRFDYEPTLRSFYRASNYVLNTLVGPDTGVLMFLLYTNCVSIVLWGCEVKDFLSCEFKQLKSAVNGAIRKIFSCSWIEVPVLRASLGYRPLEELFEAAKSRFHRSLANSPNQTVIALFNLRERRS